VYPVRQHREPRGNGKDIESLAIPVPWSYNVPVVPAPDTHSLSLRLTVPGCPMEAVSRRLEERTHLTVRVDLCSLDIRNRTHEGLTDNISTHGARVVSSDPLRLNERLNLWSLPGDFRARARVVYCEPLGHNSFAIGLQLLATTGDWK